VAHKVLYICHNHPKVRPGGAETYAHELHLAMRSQPGWEPTFLAKSGPPLSRSGRPHEGTYVSPVAGAEAEYFLYTDGYDFDWLYGTMRHSKELYTRHLREFLLAIEPDVVHFQHTLFVGYDAIRETRRTLPGVPIVYTLHEFLPICHNKGQMVRTMDGELCAEESPRRCSECFPEISPQTFLLRKRFIRAQLGLVDLFVAPSVMLLERFVEWGLPRERILLEEYGRRAPVGGRATGREPPHDRLGFFGQLNPYKGIDVLLAALAELAADAPPSAPADAGALRARPQLRVHGANLDLQEHGFRDRVGALLAQAGDHVSSLGAYAPEQIGELMAAVDWVVVPSTWWENSPLVIQEAFAHGRPVICSDIGGMAEKVAHERNGLHFRTGDAGSLAATIRRAVETPGMWERLRAGIRPVHSLGEHVGVLAGAYERLIEQRRTELAA
jgi:glycosyltransferase involved in cell wall biosynthesis